MKRLKWILGLALIALVPVFAFVGLAKAQQFTRFTEEGQVIHSSLYSSGKNIDIKGTVYGDIYCAGQSITIEATVYGDVLCAGQDITIAGDVKGDVRVAGQLVTFKGNVQQNAFVGAMTFSLDAESKIGQDLTLAGDSHNVKGLVGRDITASGNTFVLNGSVGRNVTVSSQNVELKQKADVSGGLYYTSNKNATLAAGAEVKGKTEKLAPKQEKQQNIFRSFSLGMYLFMLAGLTLVSLALAFLFPKFLRKTSGRIKESFVRALIVGIVATFLVPAISLGFVFSVVGIPLSLVLLLAALFGAVLSGPITAFYVGGLILRKDKSAPLVVLVGSLVVVTAYFLPLMGLLFGMLALWMGFGALLLELKAHSKLQKA